MASHKYSSPHDRALIAFASDVLATLEHHTDWNGDTFQELSDSAHNFGLSTNDDAAQFRVIPRQRFRNPLEL